MGSAAEDELVSRCLDGEPERFAELVRPYLRALSTVCLRMVGREDVAAELVQETLTRTYAGLSRFQQGKKFSAWLFQIALNLCKDNLKRGGQPDRAAEIGDISGEESPWHHAPENPERIAIRAQDAESLLAALNRLKPAYREILILKHVEGLRYEEIHEITGLPITTLKVRLVRAREQMVHLLEKTS